ncbi:WD40 repeat-like protein [Polychaeton citri CBS 116435]|uniref:WD40 repeat-like protein n=1 Tax=Polychaeton citri CBS 116435 TaxID=1314669 RepID=A0A9P4Q6F6_9PEZI|nr:WD40 repeat-like protein [Polychaeton citri CBS 116435]
MALKAGFKTTFEPSRVIQPIYTGGAVSLSENARILASSLGEEVLLTDLETGTVLARIEGDGEPVTTLNLTPNKRYLTVCSRSLSMRIYALDEFDEGETSIETKLLRTLRPHTAPVVTCTSDPSSSLLATGGADGAVKVWDLRGGYATHTFHGHSGVISALHIFQTEAGQEVEHRSKSKKRKSRQQIEDVEDTPTDSGSNAFRLASGGEDGKVRIWDLHKRKSIVTLDSHVSVVRCLDYSPELKALLSASRDKTVTIWDAKTWEAASTVPVLEVVESAGFLEKGRYIFTGGESGTLRLWHTMSGGEVMLHDVEGTSTDAIVDILHYPSLDHLITVHEDQTLNLRSLKALHDTLPEPPDQIEPLEVLRRISGTHDEVIDLAYVGGDRNVMALATNLEDIRLISLNTKSAHSSSQYFGADLGLLKGHSDIVITMSVDWSGHWLATGAKDNTARLWRLDPANQSYTSWATFTGHAESIGAVALPPAWPSTSVSVFSNPLSHPPKFLISGSQDKTVKRWEIPTTEEKASRASYTRKAHDKDINAIAISYGANPLFASASQDRTVKIWDAESGETIGVLRGHKRGIWTVAFSPTDIPALTTNAAGGGASSSKGMVVTGSGDKTVRIWSLSDYSCLRTFEGHANSVLKVVWLLPSKDEKSAQARHGARVASAAGDGLVKVWDAQEGECAATLDNHIDRVWALTVKPATISEHARHESHPSEKRKMQDEDANMTDGEDAEGDRDSSATSLTLVSGSADATLTFWNDTTATTAEKTTAKASARIEQDQELQNQIRAKNYREAIVLALQLNHPRRLLELFTDVANRQPSDVGSFTGSADVDGVITGLSDGQLWLLLKRIRDWNANARSCGIAQRVLFAVLRLVGKERVLGLGRRRKLQLGLEVDGEGDGQKSLAEGLDGMQLQDDRAAGKGKEGIRDVLDGLKAYTQKHYERLERASGERFVLVWALEQMDAVGGGDGQSGLVNGNKDADVVMV